jgi:hypothetical protein
MATFQEPTKADQQPERAARRNPQAETPLEMMPGLVPRGLERALANPRSIRPETLLQLQRTIGNRAVHSLLQRELLAGPGGEANRRRSDREAQPATAAGHLPSPLDQLVERIDGSAAITKRPGDLSIVVVGETFDARPERQGEQLISTDYGQSFARHDQVKSNVEGSTQYSPNLEFAHKTDVFGSTVSRVRFDGTVEKSDQAITVNGFFRHEVNSWVPTGAGPDGQIALESPDDPNITVENRSEIVQDLRPGTGSTKDLRPRRERFFVPKITVEHEKQHADWFQKSFEEQWKQRREGWRTEISGDARDEAEVRSRIEKVREELAVTVLDDQPFPGCEIPIYKVDATKYEAFISKLKTFAPVNKFANYALDDLYGMVDKRRTPQLEQEWQSQIEAMWAQLNVAEFDKVPDHISGIEKLETFYKEAKTKREHK